MVECCILRHRKLQTKQASSSNSMWHSCLMLPACSENDHLVVVQKEGTSTEIVMLNSSGLLCGAPGISLSPRSIILQNLTNVADNPVDAW